MLRGIDSTIAFAVSLFVSRSRSPTQRSGMTWRPVFEGVAPTMIDAFVTRADRMLVSNPPPDARGDFSFPGVPS